MQNVRLPDGLAQRFLADLGAIALNLEDLTFGLCVSGGPDSLALLLLATEAGLNCRAATVDHGLRPEAKAEAEFVANLCAKLAISHATLIVEGKAHGNVSAWARRERYEVLLHWAEKHKIDALLTAHHADDQLETMIMRLNRGSGVAGLAGVRGMRDGLIRPLLGWRKAELENLVAQAGISPVDDPSNRDDRFDRARLRKALADADWLDPVMASRSAAALADAEEALEWTTTAYENRRVAEQMGVVSFDPKSLPKELVRRITLRCLRRVAHEAEPRGEELDRLIMGLTHGRVATLAGVKCSGGTFWLFEKAMERKKN